VHRLDVTVAVPELGTVTGDVAWGGNWFFIARMDRLDLAPHSADALVGKARAVRAALRGAGITGAGGEEIDHIQFIAPAHGSDADARNFVLCSGGQYDRSPCGTGTCAGLAVLRARGRLDAGRLWQQESITGSRFTSWFTEEGGRVIPHIRGHAYITGEAKLRFDPADPFRAGFTTAP
jgi:4-hydroxyproline epimerase